MAIKNLSRPPRSTTIAFGIEGRAFGLQFDTKSQTSGEEVEAALRALEGQNPPLSDLAEALMDAFHQMFPRFMGLSRGFQRRQDLRSNDAEMGLWALTVLKDGWRILDYLGISPQSLVRYLLARWPPKAWLDDVEFLRVPLRLRPHLQPEGLYFGPGSASIDLRWLPSRLACSLTIQGPVPGILLLPPRLEVRGDTRITQVECLGVVQGIGCRRRTMTLEAITGLDHVELSEDTRLQVRRCPGLTTIRGKLTADLVIEDCPSLENIDVVFPRDALPAPSVSVRRCNRLWSIGRASSRPGMCMNLALEDCPQLTAVNVGHVRYEKVVVGCPKLQP